MWLKPADVLVQGQRLLRYYSFYALLLSLMLVILDSLDTANTIVAHANPHGFLLANTAYVFWSALMLVFSSSRLSTHPQYAVSFFFGDITLLIIMMQASGGLGSGFSNLILIPIFISNLLVTRSLGYSVAAWTTIAIIYTQHFLPWQFNEKEVFTSGLYGFFCFTLAFLTQTLSNKLNSTLDLTYRQAENISRLRKINKNVLLALPNAIIACDKENRVLLSNEMAQRWFECNDGQTLPPGLMNFINHSDCTNIRFEHNEYQLILNKSPLVNSVAGDYVLVIEDSRDIAAEAQQIKLASLGRLTASIAHEIRNPLSALRHAAQLLAEAPDLAKGDVKLTQIIEQHCMRINRTVEDILQISRRNHANVEVIKLKPWLEHFKDSFQQAHDESFSLSITCSPDYLIKFDPDQLQQVLHNICGNGLRYALLKHPNDAQLRITAKQHIDGSVHLYLMDNGPGISEDNQKNLFEPFFTTEHSGTGLGLYLCREICEANKASIKHIASDHLAENLGTCFSLNFAKVT
ncbi:MAG: two-component system sensor histidine kinase PilS (NtrC family) [Oleispira sp.]|jgi:two-component system sensor histidine kinase PilS (NtrC family)